MSSAKSDTPWITTVFDDSPQNAPKHRDSRDAYRVPPETAPLTLPQRDNLVPTSKFSQVAIDKPTSPREDPLKKHLHRPLPEIPTRQSSLRQEHSRKHSSSLRTRSHSRNSSVVSRAPSIAASLLSYVERDSMSPEPEVRIASLVTIPRPRAPSPDHPRNMVMAQESESESEKGFTNGSCEDFEESPTPNVPSKRRGIAAAAPDSIFSMMNVTVRKHRRLSPHKPTSSDFKPETPPYVDEKGTLPTVDPPEREEEPTLVDNLTTLSLTESEWMCRTPSPVKDGPEHVRVEQFWSPAIDKGTSDGGRTLRKNAMEWYDKIRGVEEPTVDPDNEEKVVSGNDRMRMIPGNWI